MFANCTQRFNLLAGCAASCWQAEALAGVNYRLILAAAEKTIEGTEVAEQTNLGSHWGADLPPAEKSVDDDDDDQNGDSSNGGWLSSFGLGGGGATPPAPSTIAKAGVQSRDELEAEAKRVALACVALFCFAGICVALAVFEFGLIRFNPRWFHVCLCLISDSFCFVGLLIWMCVCVQVRLP